MRAVNPARIARTLVTLLVLTSIQLVGAPLFSDTALAYTQGTVTNGTAYGGTGGGANAANQNCSNGAIVAIGATKSGDNLNGFMFVCKTIANDATLTATEATTTVFGSPSESDRCTTGQIGIGVRVIASNGGSLVGGVGLICGNPMSQGNSDTRSIMPNASSAGTVYTYTCPTGQLLAGFALRTGALVDQLIPKCSSFSGFAFAAVGAPSATVTGNSALVTFSNVAGSIADTALTYTVSAVPYSGTTITVTGSSSPITVPGLVLRANYTITVTASNAYGSSPATGSTTAAMALPGSDTDTALTLGGSKFAQVAANTAVNAADSFTFEVWTYLTSYNSSDWNMVLNKESSYEIGVTNGYWYYAFLGSTWTGVNTGIAYELNTWHHIAVTRLAGANVVKFYLDGALVFSGTADGLGTGSIATSTYPLTIGGRSATVGAATALWAGQLDEVRLFSTVRTAAEIASDMHSYLSPTTPGLTYYYDFNEGSGTTIYNRLSSATSTSDLTLYNSASFTDIKDVSTTALTNYTTVTFKRSYINVNGGWKVPANVSSVSALVVAGGGGGGWNSGGGGGGGGVLSTNRTTYSGNVAIKVGAGGPGALSTDSGQTPTYAPTNGQSSQLGATSVAGGNAGSVFIVSTAGGAAITTASGSSGAGGNGAASSGTPAGAGGAGIASSYSGSSVIYGSGGGGGGYASAGGAAGSGAGAGGGNTTQIAGVSALPNRGGGGGASAGHVFAGNGGSGIIIIHWITALKPTFTQPSNTYLNAGMSESFTVNVASDSASVNLTRTFRWESSTSGVNGPYSTIKEGTGAANAYFAWVPQDTATSGSNFLYRVVVTDSDTAGLYIVDTSTAVYAVINRALSVNGNAIISKAINVGRSETFTITLGTSTYRPSLSPVISGISLDTSTAGLAIVRISDTATVGTYYETLTVLDSVSASVTIPLTISVVAPPSFSANAEQVVSGTYFHLDAGSSASYTGTGNIVSDLSGRNLTTNLTYNFGTTSTSASGASRSTTYLNSVTCTAPTYSSDGNGSLVFNGSTSCAYIAGVGYLQNYSFEVWLKRNGNQAASSAVITTPYRVGSDQINMSLQWDGANGLLAAIFNGNTGGGWYSTAAQAIPNLTWVHATVTYNGTTLSLILNGETTTSVNPVATWNAAIIDNGLLVGRKWDSTPTISSSIGSIRIYNRVLSLSEIQQNYNATRGRFADTQNSRAETKKYGVLAQETYTVTSGLGNLTATLALNSQSALKWDTSTARSVKLSLQESLTVGTYYETLTATDSLGQSSYLPLKYTITKADTLTISMDTGTVMTFNGSAISLYPKPIYKGLAGLDTLTVTTKFSADSYSLSAIAPINADTYTVIAADPIFTTGAASNYYNIIYETSTAVIIKARQAALNPSMYGAVLGSPFAISLLGGSGDGAVTETLTGTSTAPNCAVSNHILTSSATQISYCQIKITKATSQNYLSESVTVQIYFMNFLNNQPSQAGAGSTIGLTGSTPLSLDPNQAPAISSISISSGRVGDSVTITGSGFTASALRSVKFWRNILASIQETPTNTQIVVLVPTGATTGKIIVTTLNGQAVTEGSFTVLP